MAASYTIQGVKGTRHVHIALEIHHPYRAGLGFIAR